MRKVIVKGILVIWQLVLAVSSFIMTQSVWWFWCAICFIFAVIISAVWELKQSEKDELEKYRKENIERLKSLFNDEWELK